MTNQRVMAAEELLEASGSSIERIATAVGFGNAAIMGQHFGRVRGVSPQGYRQSFSCPA